MLWICLIASIIIGLLRGGKISRFSKISFKSLWIFILAIVLQIAIILFGMEGTSFIIKYAKELYIASYVLLFIGIILNIKRLPFTIILIGSVLNLFVFVMNSGSIPVSVEGLELAGLENVAKLVKGGDLALYSPLTESTKYAVLGQIITIQQPYPFPQLISIGDVIVALGLFIFIQSIMLDDGLDRKTMVRFS